MPQTRVALALGLAAIVIVSMALGGGAVAAAYESRLSEQRDALVSTLQQRATIAQQRVDLARKHLESVRQRVSVGIEPERSVLDVELRLTEAESELNLVRIDLDEVQAGGQEPKQAMSAPLIAGKDFVVERWRALMAMPMAALELEKRRLIDARRRIEIGVGDRRDADEATVRIVELEAAVKSIERKIAIRQAFLMGGMPAAVADLRGLEAETDQRRSALARRLELARKHVTDLRSRHDVGTANPFSIAEAELRLQEMQLELTKADYDLLLIRKQLGKD
jgi:Outer membrane efflux protein